MNYCLDNVTCMYLGPMRGIPSRTPGSIGYRSPGAAGRDRFAGSSTPMRTTANQREGGIKVSVLFQY